MRVCTIIGARPQFIKAAVVSQELAQAGIEEVLIHTGQNYDPEMSRVFFDQLGLREPDVNLGVGSGSHAIQTGRMMVDIERFVADTGPYDWMVVYGDTNSTIAGALVAAKAGISQAHVEAGLRSFNRKMPEEINRIVTDSLAELLFAPTDLAVQHLTREGVEGQIVLSGDVMLDSTRHFLPKARGEYPARQLLPSDVRQYILATVHRAENTDSVERFDGILEAFAAVPLPVVFPMHPRTRAVLGDRKLPANVRAIAPVGYLEMLSLVSSADVVVTDSGGLQKEAHWIGTPCVTLRAETEWTETLAGGWNQLADADPVRIREAIALVPDRSRERTSFGDPAGRPASRIIAETLAAGRTSS